MAVPKPRIPYKRPARLNSCTYKIHAAEVAYYITISDGIHCGEHRPVEIFIRSKDAKSVMWMDFTTRLMSASLQQAGDFPHWIIKELKKQFDADGGYFVQKGDAAFKRGLRVNSVLHHIGLVLEEHLEISMEMNKKG